MTATLRGEEKSRSTAFSRHCRRFVHNNYSLLCNIPRRAPARTSNSTSPLSLPHRGNLALDLQPAVINIIVCVCHRVMPCSDQEERRSRRRTERQDNTSIHAQTHTLTRTHRLTETEERQPLSQPRANIVANQTATTSRSMNPRSFLFGVLLPHYITNYRIFLSFLTSSLL